MLTIFTTADRILSQLQTSWASDINPIITKAQNQSIILPSVPLVIGPNVINHRLGKKLQGWSLTRQRAAANIYDNQDANQSPALTLVLISDANVSVDIEVF